MTATAAPAGFTDLGKAAKEAERKLRPARQERAWFEPKWREVFMFTMPQRIPPGTTSTTPPSDTEENFASQAEQVTSDFASDIADTFTPEHTKWAGVEIVTNVPKDQWPEDLEDKIKAENEIVFGAIAASNFYDAIKMGNKDLSVSAFGLQIDDPGFGQPLRCQVVPLTELLIARSATGGIGVRFSERQVCVEDLDEFFPGVPLPPKAREKRAKNPATKIKLTQGCWRDFSVPGEVAWHVIAMADAEAITYARVKGEGSAPMQVNRWDPDPCFAYGRGSGLKALADFREQDEVAYLGLKAFARAVDPAFAYDDDSVMNFEGGLTNGSAIPRMKGSKIDVIEAGGNFDMTFYKERDVEDRIRRHYYLDQPEQEGKTPPTATQWTDENLRRMRRLGTPAAPMWSEFLSEVYLRFRYLLVQRGVLDPQIKVGGEVIQLRPVNPLKIAAQQVEAVATERFFGIISQYFGPQVAAMAVNLGSTVHKIKDLLNASGADLKSAADIDAAMQKMQQMLAAQQMAQTVNAAGLTQQPGAGQ